MYLLHDTIFGERFFLSAQCVSLIKASKVCINLTHVGGCNSLWKWEHVKATISQRARSAFRGPSLQSMFPPWSGCEGRALCTHCEYQPSAAVSARGSRALDEAPQTFNGVHAGLLQCLLPSRTPGQGSDRPRLQPGRGGPAAPRPLDLPDRKSVV